MSSGSLPFRLNSLADAIARRAQRCHCAASVSFPRAQSAAFYRPISTSPLVRAEKQPLDLDNIKAAPEIQFDDDKTLSPREKKQRLMKRVRVVPLSPSYFSAQPSFVDSLLHLQAVLRKYIALPTIPSSSASRVSWKTLNEYRSDTGERIRESKYQELLHVLNRMRLIHPSLMPLEVTRAMEAWKRDIQPNRNRPKPVLVDEFGRAPGIGRRKASSAKAWLVEGEGEVLVNGKVLSEMFSKVYDRESAIWPLKVTQRIDKYNVFATVMGGGTTGQAEAVTMAVAKALMVHEPMLKPALRRAGCVTRDPRVVERKKPGKRKARKMPAWVKR